MNYNYNKKDGITYGTCTDICIDCAKEKEDIKRGDLEYQEVFKVNNNGLEVCYCIEHFKKKLGKYMLIDTSLMVDENEETEKTNAETNLLTNGSTNCDTIEETNCNEMVEPINEPKKTTAKRTKKTTIKE